jgi:hypothetical protein
MIKPLVFRASVLTEVLVSLQDDRKAVLAADLLCAEHEVQPASGNGSARTNPGGVGTAAKRKQFVLKALGLCKPNLQANATSNDQLKQDAALFCPTPNTRISPLSTHGGSEIGCGRQLQRLKPCSFGYGLLSSWSLSSLKLVVGACLKLTQNLTRTWTKNLALEKWSNHV